MKSLVCLSMALATIVHWLPTDALAKDSPVRGHVTKNGNYVPPHHRTSPDKSKANNYGSKGNYNPYTGKTGTKDPAKP